ncbi:MAG: flavin reductase family protein [Candidatus Melainabacteria bacterium]|nr:flavin reductase family protein [Candidatus Melainabacteria bacterium]
MTTETTQKEGLGKALGRIASGVFLVTFTNGGKKDGMLSTFVMQAGFKPPVVVVAVNNKRPLLDVLRPGDTFAINVLSKANMDAYKNFAKPYQEGMDRYEGVKLRDGTEHPILANCISYMKCKVISYAETGDHQLLISEAIDGEQLNDEEPLIHLRKNGFGY